MRGAPRRRDEMELAEAPPAEAPPADAALAAAVAVAQPPTAMPAASTEARAGMARTVRHRPPRQLVVKSRWQVAGGGPVAGRGGGPSRGPRSNDTVVFTIDVVSALPTSAA